MSVISPCSTPRAAGVEGGHPYTDPREGCHCVSLGLSNLVAEQTPPSRNS